jgi:Phosphoglucose isomerase
MQAFPDRRSAIPARARPAWKALETCCQELQRVHLRDFFAGEVSDAILAECLSKHSFFNQGAIWQVNRFDPWGVGMGKVPAQLTIPGLESVAEPPAGHDGSTNRLMRHYRKLKEAS